MAERTLKRDVESAARFIDDAVLGEANPIREIIIVPQRRTLIREIAEGERSISAVLQYEESAREVMSDSTALSEISERMRRMFLPPQEAFREAERGHRRPASVFRTRRGAYAHFRGECERAGVRERGGRPGREDMEQLESLREEVAASLFTPRFLGSQLHHRFSRSPPIITLHGNSVYDELDRAEGSSFPTYGGGSNAKYYSGTNHITIRESVADYDEADQASLLIHEQLHYASWLGGGSNSIRWINESGEPVVHDKVDWLHEGLTELHASQMARSQGYEPTFTSYPYETAVAFYIQRMVGDRTLREAYLTGDFTQVRRRLDARLGAGSFDRLASMSRGWQALSFIMPEMAGNKIDFTRWERDPVLTSCFGHIEAIDERGGGW